MEQPTKPSPALRTYVAPGLRDEPYVWLAVLERARREGDYDLAAYADAELRRLGVRVSYDALDRVREVGS